jgi:Ca-activated chloride channel family protein
MRSARLFASACLVVLGAATALRGAQPVFRSGGVTVPVHATVTDSSHRLVTNLDVDSFIVSDDHGVRPITVFERKELPVSVVMLLDASESMRLSTEFLRDAAKQFVANLRPGDRMEIAAFHNTIRWVRPFTSNQQTLNRALDLFTPKMIDFGTALWPAMCEGLKEFYGVQGRKVLLVFSDGENNYGTFNHCLMVAQAIAEDIMIYAIALQTEYNDRFTRRRTKSKLDPLLPAIPAETGGGYFELTRTADLAATFRRVAEELHHQYLIGFEAPVLDGETHPITVQVKGEGLTARARRSYLAARQK